MVSRASGRFFFFTLQITRGRRPNPILIVHPIQAKASTRAQLRRAYWTIWKRKVRATWHVICYQVRFEVQKHSAMKVY